MKAIWDAQKSLKVKNEEMENNLATETRAASTWPDTCARVCTRELMRGHWRLTMLLTVLRVGGRVGDSSAETRATVKGTENYERLRRDNVADTIKTPHARDAARGISPTTAEGPAR